MWMGHTAVSASQAYSLENFKEQAWESCFIGSLLCLQMHNIEGVKCFYNLRLQRGPLEPADPILQVPVVPADPEILPNQVVEEAEQAVGSILILRQTFFV